MKGAWPWVSTPIVEVVMSWSLSALTTDWMSSWPGLGWASPSPSTTMCLRGASVFFSASPAIEMKGVYAPGSPSAADSSLASIAFLSFTGWSSTMNPWLPSVTPTMSSGVSLSITASAAPRATWSARASSIVSITSTTATLGFSLRLGRSMRTGSAVSSGVFCQPPGP